MGFRNLRHDVVLEYLAFFSCFVKYYELTNLIKLIIIEQFVVVNHLDIITNLCIIINLISVI